MRVIAGRYRARKIKSPPDRKTRPTSDRLRETLFNIIGPIINGETRFLDLCAGTGAIGIEALSRDAGFCCFVDKSRRNCGLIEQNLDLLEIPETETTVEAYDAAKFLKLDQTKPFDLIYYDPPYDTDYSAVLAELGSPESKILSPICKVMVEHHFKTTIPDEIGGLRRWRMIKQGETSLSFFEFD